MTQARPAGEILELVADESPPAIEGAWLRHRRPKLRHRLGDTWSAPFFYEHVERAATDAVVVVLHRERQVLLRTALRPPVAFRSELDVPLKGDALDDWPLLWEVPAGLIEAHEVGPEGIAACAARETLEETGFDLPAHRFSPLGRASFLSPGVIAEQLHFFVAELRGEVPRDPEGDGSPAEAGAEIRFVDLDEAIAMVGDAKSELALLRLSAALRQERRR